MWKVKKELPGLNILIHFVTDFIDVTESCPVHNENSSIFHSKQI